MVKLIIFSTSVIHAFHKGVKGEKGFGSPTWLLAVMWFLILVLVEIDHSVLKILSGLVIFLFHQTVLDFSRLLSHSFGTNVCEIMKRLNEPL